MFVEMIMLHCYGERERYLSLSFVTMRERDREITTKRYVLHRERERKRKLITTERYVLHREREREIITTSERGIKRERERVREYNC